MGGSVVLLGSRSFDADELWDLVQRHRVTQISLVGDAFARPLNEALDAAEADGVIHDLTSVTRGIVSTGATLSVDQERSFQRRLPNAVIIDMIGASEGGPYAMSMTMPGTEPPETAVFTAPPNVVTIDPVTDRCFPGDPRFPGCSQRPVRCLGATGRRRKDRPDLPHDRRGSLHGTRRLRHDCEGRHRDAARPWLGVHQLRRREDLPRRGRGGGPQAPERGRRQRRRRPARALR